MRCAMDVESFSAVNGGHKRLGIKVPGIRMYLYSILQLATGYIQSAVYLYRTHPRPLDR